MPVDGEVIDGRSSIDESMVSGESMPVDKEAGAQVVAGTLNRSGSFVMRAAKVGGDTLIARIVQMVAQAQRSRAPIQRLADDVSRWFVPSVIGVALIAFLAWASFGPEPRLAYGLVAAVSVLIIACPCALGLATPMSIMVGTGRGARAGVLVRNAEALEAMERVDTLVVDKTGTLTEGKPRLVGVTPIGGHDENGLLRLVASLERASEHPLAAAIVAGAEARGLALAPVADFKSITGQGVAGTIENRQVAVGNTPLLVGLGIDPDGLPERADALRRDGNGVMLVAVDGIAAGLVAVADPIKESARAALAGLRDDGIRIVMLTGDSRTTADAVARRLAINEIVAEILLATRVSAGTRKCSGRSLAAARG